MRDGQPSHTAFGAAKHRAVHQDLDHARIFRDPLAWRILGADKEAVLAEAEAHSPLRTFIAARHRVAEDALAEAAAACTRQAVVLGAGLDTLAYRNSNPSLRVFEVDAPATGAWKLERLAEAGIPLPPTVAQVGVDFEDDGFLDALADSGFKPDAPAFFSLLGVIAYLTRDAVKATLAAVASLPSAEIVFDYPTPRSEDSPRAELAARVARAGEPFESTFEPDEMRLKLEHLGLEIVDEVDRDEIRRRFFGLRGDGRPANGARILHVRTA